MSRGTVSGNGIVTNGLVLALDAANPRSYVSGSTVWSDLTSNNNTGSLINNVTYTSANGGSMVFDGVSSYISFGNKKILDFTTDFSISAWINRNSIQFSIDSGIIAKSTINDTYAGYMLWYNGNTIDLHINNTIIANSTTTIQANTWYFVIGTYNGTTGCLYLNGVLNASGNVSTVSNSTNANFNIGRYELTSRNFTGNISLALIYNRALSAQEVLQNYNATKTRFGL